MVRCGVLEIGMDFCMRELCGKLDWYKCDAPVGNKHAILCLCMWFLAGNTNTNQIVWVCVWIVWMVWKVCIYYANTVNICVAWGVSVSAFPLSIHILSFFLCVCRPIRKMVVWSSYFKVSTQIWAKYSQTYISNQWNVFHFIKEKRVFVCMSASGR